MIAGAVLSILIVPAMLRSGVLAVVPFVCYSEIYQKPRKLGANPCAPWIGVICIPRAVKFTRWRVSAKPSYWQRHFHFPRTGRERESADFPGLKTARRGALAGTRGACPPERKRACSMCAIQHPWWNYLADDSITSGEKLRN
jgi:hypothetical protein